MPIVDQFGNQILRPKAATAGYDPGPRHIWGRQPRDLPIFNFSIIRFMLYDPTVRLGLAMRAGPVAAAEFSYQDGEQWVPGIKADRDDVKHFVERQLKRLWMNDIDKILKSQIWGWSSGEVMYQVQDGLVEFDQLLDRHPRDSRALEFNGKLAGTLFTGVRGEGKGKAELAIPGKGYWHAFEAESGQHYGTSVLFGAYSSWADKWFDGGALDVRRLFMHSDAYGGMRIGYPPGTTELDGKGEVPNRDIAREMAEQYKSGHVMTHPVVYDDKGNLLWVVTDPRVTSTPNHILQYPKDLDVEILRGMEIPDDVVTAESSGAWQGKQVPMQAFYNGLNKWAFSVARMVVSQIIEPLVLWNWGRPEDFEATLKPLEVQAMEQQKSDGGNKQQPKGQPGEDDATGGFLTAPPSQNGNPSPNGASRLALDVESAVGEGFLSAAQVVKAAQRFLVSENGKTDEIITVETVTDETVHEFSSTQFEIPPDVSIEIDELASVIDEGDVNEEAGGIETEHHITVLFGIHADDDSQLRHLLRDEGPIAVRLGKTSLFRNDEFDVLKIGVESVGLHALHNRILDAVPNTQSHPDYVPHLTVAYLNPGTGDQYEGLSDLDGTLVVFDELVFSDKRRRKTKIKLSGMVRFAINRAPVGGITIGGKEFKGGEFMPGDVVADATTSEKRALRDPAKKKPKKKPSVKARKPTKTKRKKKKKRDIPPGVKATKARKVAKLPKQKATRRKLNARAQRAIKTHKPSTRQKQVHALANEDKVANGLKGTRVGDNHPPDVLVEIDGKLHAFEVKSLLDNTNDKITMHPSSRRKKEAWGEENNAVFHTIVIDDRDVYNKGQNKSQFSGHKIYYKAGVGAFRVGKMGKVASFKDIVMLLKEQGEQ